MKALIHSSHCTKNHLPHLRNIYLSTCTILFMGTPHLGSEFASTASSAVLTRVVWVFWTTDPELLKHLKRDSEWLGMQLTQYKHISMEFNTVFFFERLETTIFGGKKELVVPLVFKR